MEINCQRGDIVICAFHGDYGKPRPAVVVQSDIYIHHASVTLCPISSEIVAAPIFRLLIEPGKTNGLREISQIMVDKLTTYPREKIRQKVGSLTKDQRQSLDDALKMWLSLV